MLTLLGVIKHQYYALLLGHSRVKVCGAAASSQQLLDSTTRHDAIGDGRALPFHHA